MNGNCVGCHLILCIYHKTHSPRLFKPVACAGCRHWGGAERRRRSILVYNRSGYFGGGDGSVSTSSAKHGCKSINYTLKIQAVGNVILNRENHKVLVCPPNLRISMTEVDLTVSNPAKL